MGETSTLQCTGTQQSKEVVGEIGLRAAGFVDDVQRAHELVYEETDATFREFWEWRLDLVEAELRLEKQWAK